MTLLPRAIAAGAEIRDLAMVGRIEVNNSDLATGVHYHREGRHGLRIPRITYSWCDNDRRLIDHSLSFMSTALEVVGAKDLWRQEDDTCHLNGTARMGSAPHTSVVNADCRSWDIQNLWICDGSVFPTVGGVNPSLTIQAIACRTADRIKALAARGEL